MYHPLVCRNDESLPFQHYTPPPLRPVRPSRGAPGLTGVGCLAILLAFAGVASLPASAKERVEMVDVIVQADGSCDAVGRWVENAGGQVRFRYRNVPALAVTLPAHQLTALGNVAGVGVVEKDRVFYLNELSRNAADRTQAYVAAARPGHQVQGLTHAALSGHLPTGYANFIYSGASQVWSETGYGQGSVVAVVDTGVARNVALSEAVIGAPGFPNGYNAYPDGFDATDPGNNWHGTFVAGVVAGAAVVELSDPTEPLYQAIATHLPHLAPAAPGGPIVVPILGQAPFAQIYPVKVFPHEGGGTPNSIILDGLDHVLSLKKSGALDIDIVNLSLGGPTVWDGLNAFDRFLSELTAAHILVVAAAGNEGPIPNSVGSPATSFATLSVGALDYAPSSRVLYEWLGLSAMGLPGMGLTMRPTTETRVANFSCRGPLSDGRVGPEIAALGSWNFGVAPDNSLMWAGGTSFSSPTVAGAAALLNAYWEAHGQETAPAVLQTALVRGADPTVVGRKWRDPNDQGFGALDAPAALENLKRKRCANEPDKLWRRPLQANILGVPDRGRTQQWSSGRVEVSPSEVYNAVLEVGRSTSRVTVEVYDIEAPNNMAKAYWPNALEVHVQSAKRTAAEHPLSVYWYPFLYGNSFTLTIEDGPWTFAGDPWTYQPMEPGLMKISFLGDASNEAPVRFKVRIKRENHLPALGTPIAQGKMRSGDNILVPVDIPAGKTRATFDLRWDRDWTDLPTSDFDLFLLDANGQILTTEGATLNAPERVVLSAPAAGRYYLFIDAFEVYKRDNYRLYQRLE